MEADPDDGQDRYSHGECCQGRSNVQGQAFIFPLGVLPVGVSVYTNAHAREKEKELKREFANFLYAMRGLQRVHENVAYEEKKSSIFFGLNHTCLFIQLQGPIFLLDALFPLLIFCE